MKNSLLSLNYYFVTRSSVVAATVPDTDDIGEPQVSIDAHVTAADALAVVISVIWGTEGVTPYYVNVEMYGSFKLDGVDTADFLLRTSPEEFYSSVSLNAAQIVFSALRSHVVAVTAAGPHRAWFIPATVIEASDVRLYGDEKVVKAKPKKSTRKKAVKRS